MEKIIDLQTERIYRIFQYMFLCCFPKKDEFILDFKRREDDSMNYKNDELIDGVYSVFPSKYIREDEREHLKFSKDYILNYLSELSQKNFINKYDDSTLKLSILFENEFSNKIPVLRSEIIIKKSLFKKHVPTLEEFVASLLIPEIRLKWDKTFKEFEILKIINENTQITRMVSTSQLTMISEREFVEKKTFFIDNGVFYYFCSSVPDELYPPQKEPVRVRVYLGIMIIKEDVENFYFDSFNQVDIKMDLPEVLIVMSYPMKIKELKDGIVNIFNK